MTDVATSNGSFLMTKTPVVGNSFDGYP